MKKILLILCCCLLFTATTCYWECDTRHQTIKFYNATDYVIYISQNYHYPDTSLVHERDVSVFTGSYNVEAHSVNGEALNCDRPYEIELGNSEDTLMVFVYNADTLAFYGWEYVKEHYLIAQRYDLSLGDLQQLNWRLQFPPSPKMQNIKMWPPYGTYDSLGHLVQ